MQLAKVSAKQKKKFKVTTDSKHKLPVAPNVLPRNFTVPTPDIAYCTDITYVLTIEGWLCLAVVIDLYSRKVVGWSLSHRMTKGLVVSTLQMAIWRRSPTSGFIFYSDRGSQYCSNDFQKFLKKYKMISSMSPGKRRLREENGWDNSVAESFFGSLKTERVHDVLYSTRRAAKNDIIDYIEMFYNSRRRNSFLGCLCPNEFELLIELKRAA